MSEILLITAQEITDTTILGGNIDLDKYRFCVFDAQKTVLEPLLGTLLYEKIKTDRNILAGDYLTMFDEYIKPILKFSATASYIEIGSYMVDNGGIYRHSAEGKEQVDRSDIDKLVTKYKGLADVYIQRFTAWICDKNITEYTYTQDLVKPSNIQNVIGWKL